MPDCITITARENPVRLNSIQSRVINRKMPRALVAQLDRVLASEAKGQSTPFQEILLYIHTVINE